MAGDRHDRYQLEDARGRRFVAVCECGWRSPSFPTAGMAGTAWDGHRAEQGEP